MSTPYSPKCQRCGHGQNRHSRGTGKCKCRNSKIDPTLKGPDGACFCDCFVRGKTKAENIAASQRAANRAISAAYQAGRNAL